MITCLGTFLGSRISLSCSVARTFRRKPRNFRFRSVFFLQKPPPTDMESCECKANDLCDGITALNDGLAVKQETHTIRFESNATISSAKSRDGRFCGVDMVAS